jgi:hypothetical protein
MYTLTFNAADYNLPSNLYEYKDEIRFRITYTEEDKKIYDLKIINYMTAEIIEDLSYENIEKLFNIEYGKTVIEKSWTDKINLSELKENEIYKYTANDTVQFPEIENDVGKNCIIYIKKHNSDDYSKEIKMYKNITISTVSFSFNEYEAGESFYIMYRTAENKELLKLIDEDKFIYLSKYKDGDNLEYKFEKYIYNDTENDIIVNIEGLLYGTPYKDSITIGKNEIYGFNWMIDSANISYVKDSNEAEKDDKTEDKDQTDNKVDDSKNKEDTDTNKKTEQSDNTNNQAGQNDNNANNNNTNNQENNESTKKATQPTENTDNTTVQKSILPKAGTSNLVSIMLIISIITMITIAIKLRLMKDVK